MADRINKLWKKLVKAWSKGKEKKALKLQNKLLKEELNSKK